MSSWTARRGRERPDLPGASNVLVDQWHGDFHNCIELVRINAGGWCGWCREIDPQLARDCHRIDAVHLQHAPEYLAD
jgi:hypothetical protein